MALISDEYKSLLLEYRNTSGSAWGGGGGPHVPYVEALIRENGVRSLVDYGCGRGLLLEALIERDEVHPDRVCGYDPGVIGRDSIPEGIRFDMLVSTDVLEHIEPDCLYAVLDHMRSLADLAYLNIHTGPARAVLPDGRNAHLIQKPWDWWQERLEHHWGSVERHAEDRFSDVRPSFVCRG